MREGDTLGGGNLAVGIQSSVHPLQIVPIRLYTKRTGWSDTVQTFWPLSCTKKLYSIQLDLKYY